MPAFIKICKMCGCTFRTLAYNAKLCPSCRPKRKHKKIETKDNILNDVIMPSQGSPITPVGYVLNQAQWMFLNGVMEGTEVQVFRNAKDGENGWQGEWPTDYGLIDRIGPVMNLANEEGIVVDFDGDSLCLPYFVLQVVDEGEGDLGDDEIEVVDERPKEHRTDSTLALAEREIINRAREVKDWIEVMRAVRMAGDSFFPRCDDDPNRRAWTEGMIHAQNALFYALCLYQAEAYAFTAVGGKEALQYAREKFRERFKLNEGARNQEILARLREFLNIPASYLEEGGEA